MSAWGTVYQLERDRATGNDPDSLRAEIMRLRELVHAAYAEGFNEGTREHSTSRGGKPWVESQAHQALKTR